MKAIYKLHFDCGRQGTLRGVFVEEKERVDKLVASGAQIYFGEVLGKHSEIFGPLQTCDFTLVSDKPEDVELILNLGLENGYNPVERYIEYSEDHGKEHVFQ